MTAIHLAKPIAANHNKFFSSGDEAITYSTVEEIAQFLYQHPTTLVTAYGDSMISLASIHATWNDFRGMRETLNFLVDVRIRVAELRGEKHLASKAISTDTGTGIYVDDLYGLNVSDVRREGQADPLDVAATPSGGEVQS